jgi:hypothetical protein
VASADAISLFFVPFTRLNCLLLLGFLDWMRMSNSFWDWRCRRYACVRRYRPDVVPSHALTKVGSGDATRSSEHDSKLRIPSSYGTPLVAQ